IALAVRAVGGGAVWWLRHPAAESESKLRQDPAATRTDAAPDWPHNPELKRAIALIDSLEATLEDFRLADEISARAFEKAPSDPETVTVRARVNSAFVMRSFDFSAERTAQAKRFGERAVQLSPDDPQALYALSIFLFDRAGDLPRAETLARRACELEPGEPRFGRQLLRTVLLQRKDEGLAMGEDLIRRFPSDALSHYELSIAYRDRRIWDKFERELDATLALAPLANAINWKARAAHMRGDLAGTRLWLDRVPARARTEERTVITSMVYAALSRDYEFGLKSLQGFAEPWFYDANNYSGPAALPRAILLAQEGKAGLARAQYEVALAAVARRKAENPSDQTYRRAEVWIMLGLGRQDEARALFRTALENYTRPYQISPLSGWVFDIIPMGLLVGERATAVQLIRESATSAEGRQTIRLRLQADARMATFRDDPEITALLAEPAAAVALSEAAQLSAKALALIVKVGFTRDDLAPAEDLTRRATEKEPDNAAVWGTRAGVQSAWLFRGWDNSEKRRQDTQSFANHALALDPNEPEALLALGHVLRVQGAFDQAAALLRRASAAHPDHVRLARALGYTLTQGNRDSEGRVVLQDILQRAPRDPLLHYELALAYSSYGRGGVDPRNLAAALEQLDAAIALQPFSSALILKAALLGGWRGDLAAMRATLDQQDQLPLAERSEDRSICVGMWAALLEHRADRVEAASNLTARSYFDDLVMPFRPKGWSLALAHQLAGKDAVARSDWAASETVLRQRLKDEPGNVQYQAELAITLAWLGQRDEATRLIGLVEPMWREALTFRSQKTLALFYAAMGDAKKAVPYLATEIDQSVFTSRKVIPLDPWWDKIRGQPEFVAILKEPGGKR
ncbi:MAG: tetratricopeptide repeat protein, partial [Lacunisphaera sp.]|nr:tetratricopeptide repeat protein [Lacunisphaera sp.]